MDDRGGDPADNDTEQHAPLTPGRVRGLSVPVVRRLAILRGRLELLWQAAGVAFEREMEAGRGFLWLPVLFGLGIVTYFGLPQEPSAYAVAGLTLVLGVAAWRARWRTGVFRLLVALATVSAGLTAIKLRTDAVAAPVLSRERTVTVAGWVAAREAAGKSGARLYVTVAAMSGLAPANTPRTIRVTVQGRADTIHVGDAVRLKARLQPASGPVMPGGFDFGRDAFYGGIGAVGFAYGHSEQAGLGPPPLSIRLLKPLSELRELVRIRIEQALPDEPGRIAAALIMGDQRGISERTQNNMRASGLGHILSISGLHMALVAGAVFWLLRALLALSPGLALRRPIKKWAAGGALAAATFYLGLSGAEVATVRSWVMLAIMLLAVIADRRAITLRNVALAALAILVISPESVLSASFQMSFAATVALIAGYEALAERKAAKPDLREARERTLIGRVGEAAMALLLTSLIAGAATAPFGIYHFQRLAPLTLLANIAVAPAIGLVVMPMALATVFLIPFGLEVLPLTPMRYGLDWMTWVARKTSEWSDGLGGVHAPPMSSLLLMVAGFLWLPLWHERWRLAGLVPMVAAVVLAILTPPPDILVAADGSTAAIRGTDGRFHVVGGKGASFAVGNWLRADADPRTSRDRSLSAGVTCTTVACTATGPPGTVTVVLDQGGFENACVSGAVVVSRLPAPPDCARRATVLDGPALALDGSVALYRQSGVEGLPHFRVEMAYPSFRRPYMPVGPATSPNIGG